MITPLILPYFITLPLMLPLMIHIAADAADERYYIYLLLLIYITPPLR